MVTTVTNKSINWGGVIKGVAIVAAVVAVAVVGIWAAGAAWGYVGTLATQPGTAGALATSTINATNALGSWLTSMGTGISTAATSFWNGLPEMLGLATNSTTTAAASAAVASSLPTAKVVGGVVAAGAAAKIALPAIGAIPLTHDTTTLVAQNAHIHGAGAHAAGVHEAMTTAKHMAAEHRRPSTGWTAGLPSRKGENASFAEGVRAGQPQKASVAPRADSFSEQLNADRANLEKALGK